MIIKSGQLVQNIIIDIIVFFRMASSGHFENRSPELLPLSSMSTKVFSHSLCGPLNEF